jgi:hypothetical protein
VLGNDFSYTKVTYLYVSFVDEEVFWFDIAMDNTVLFEKFKGDDGLGDESLQDALLDLAFLV